jgi:protein-S-isoprenylcysteine O-methyltransferase
MTNDLMSHAMPLFAERRTWLAVFWLSYGAWIVMETWIFSRDRRSARGVKADAASLPLFFVLLPAALIVAFLAPHLFGFAHMEFAGAPLFYASIFLILAGVLLRIWSVITLGHFFRTTVFIHDDHRLVTSGPYRLLRHPAYAGALLTFAGIGLAMGNWISLAAALGLTGVAYGWRIAVEEKALQARFGEAFENRARQTWALIPLVW